MRNSLQTTRTLSIGGMESSRIWESGSIESHAACFGESEFCEDVSDEDVVYIAGLDFGSLYGRLHDLLRV
jgi:hypothetical protein